MWYVIQVHTGREEKIMLMIKQRISRNVCFLPKYERKRKYAGTWHREQAILFPSYIFIDTEDIEGLYIDLRKVPELTKILGTGELWTPINMMDLTILQHLLNEEYVVKISKGIIVDNRVLIEQGPLKGLETAIKKIDRHRRIATAEIQMFGRCQEIELGVEIFKKNKE